MHGRHGVENDMDHGNNNFKRGYNSRVSDRGDYEYRDSNVATRHQLRRR